MEVVEDSEICTQERIRYDRTFILNLKDVAIVLDARNVFPPVNAVDRKNVIGKPKANAVKLPQGRSRESQNIVLGPQKRTWNTGCHVSHSTEREAGHKGGTEQRSAEKHKSDFKRDFHGTDRHNGCHRRMDGNSYGRFGSRDDRGKHSRSRVEEEPEWFSEGPATVNDTIELGRLIEYDDAIVNNTSATNPPAKQKATSKNTSSAVDLPQKGHDATSVIKLPHISTAENTTTPDNQGSRFKDLFLKADIPDGASNINDQLMQLMKVSSKVCSGTPQKNDVIQVENKLRSILLGRNSQRSEISPRDHKANTGMKPKVLTVEEIEAQFNISASAAVRSGADQPHNSIHHGTSAIHPALTTAPNLTSPGAAHANNNLNFGLFPNPMMHLHTVTNAVSASARIAKLQQPDLSAPPGFSEIDNQGVLRNLWDNAHVAPVQQLPSRSHNHLHPTVTASEFPGPTTARPLGLGSTHPNNLISSMPRRPIVKAQTHDIPYSQHSFGSGDPHRIHSLNVNSTGIEKNLIDFALQPLQDYNQPDVINRMPTSNVFSSGNNQTHFGSHNAYISDALFMNNMDPNNRHLNNRTGSIHPQSNSNLAFLSQFIEMERSNASIGCSKQSSALHSLLGTNVKPKTLEEIEHQELTSSANYF